MINFKELRIGNWIDEQGQELQVGMINSSLFDSSEPILITAEWLLKFGFVKDGKVCSLKMPDYDATIQLWDRNGDMSICRSGIAAYHFPCKYVHQLQNIYYALTGEELQPNK